MANFILSAFADEAAETLDGQIEALHENNIPYLEPRSINGRGILEFSDEELLAVRKKLDGAGIAVYSIGSPVGKYPIEKDEREHLAKFDRALAAAKILGAKYVRMFSYFVKKEELDSRRDEVMARLSVLLQKAQAAGVTLCHENEAEIYGESPERVKDLLETLPALGGIFDPANYCMTGNDAKAGFEATKPSLVYCHIKDADAKTRTILPAGEGDGHIAEVLMQIDEMTDRTVTLTLEPHLKDFTVFGKIDANARLHVKYDFNNNRDSFRYAADTLKNMLKKLGYREENKIWKK